MQIYANKKLFHGPSPVLRGAEHNRSGAYSQQEITEEVTLLFEGEWNLNEPSQL